MDIDFDSFEKDEPSKKMFSPKYIIQHVLEWVSKNNFTTQYSDSLGSDSDLSATNTVC